MSARPAGLVDAYEVSNVEEIHCVLPNAVLFAMPSSGIVDDTVPTRHEYWKLVGPIRRID